jgi:hypothetical protein
VFGHWLALPGWAILLTVAVVYSVIAFVLHRVSFTREGRPRLGSFGGIVPPFISLPTVLFGLIAGFLASDIWYEARQASRAVLDERGAAMIIESLDQATPAIRTRLDSLVQDYVRTVLAEEWTSGSERGSPKVSAALNALMAEAARPEVARDATTSVQTALLNTVTRLASARSTRLALLNGETDKLKWAAVVALAVCAQLGIAVVHLERARAQAMALTVFTASAIVVLTLIGVCERPFSGLNQVSQAPLRAVLLP